MNNAKFGIELECYNVPMGDVTSALRVAGINVMTSSYSGREYSVWQVKPDCSIQGVNGFEVVSPVLEGEAGIHDVRRVCTILEQLGAKVNKSCGFHVHHNAQSWGIKEFRNLFKRFAKFETAMDSIQPASRRENANRYCQSNKIGVTVDALFAAIDSCNTMQKLSALFNHSRYMKLNLQSFFRMGSVEFRHHAGTVDADKVENYIRLTYAMVADSAEHTAVKVFAEAVTAKDALTVMLAGMVRRGRIDKRVEKFYKTRSDKFTAEAV